ncbi:MAG: CbiX/SirB N-terminal domain-containing protein [Burkholderiaceae bacterium]
MASHAVILFAHGARDARWSTTLLELQQRVQARRPDAHVAVAFLEFQPPTLEAEIDRALGAGARSIDVLPVFWANGGHMANDVPPLLAELRRRHPGLEVRLLPVLSELPGMLDFIADAATRGPA